ncbi:hypothetical protein DFA_02269 [Cavenderia fasciculata]|uniref:Formimidoyltransferase-cyclodeaminase n=1 Tax=Cavenderia fasciculata TaxID=261658 RepID=F4PYZ7_CACFS|nr:uncharacterized protein DFA_02269 [Cavenderia fasciculata]EGG19026.1 hypothetical protein DFA_02269 [Cavenderia fasciculata]|eukprot:XP_004366659.1 hypothetical protein DFA_02269 [Cavenderia fasciculata]
MDNNNNNNSSNSNNNRIIIECVPNFSEGRDQKIIDSIAKSISSIQGCQLLNVDPGVSANRTVYTFVGTPDQVVDAAVAAARTAYNLIDMAKHVGEHPRIGSLDVCPFIPVRNATIQDCIDCSIRFSERVATELNVPLYLYEFSSTKGPHRKQLRQIRSGQYEGLAEKIVSEGWEPDYGPREFVPRYGATVTGARNFLIAYNINVSGTKEQAQEIAQRVRSSGRCEGEPPGTLKMVKAIGWWMNEYDSAQVSLNLDDHNVTPIHVVYEEVKRQAESMGLKAGGSEIIGMIPLDAMLAAAQFYIERDNLFILDEPSKIALVIDRLGLNACNRIFDPEKCIVDYMIRKNDPSFERMPIHQFIDMIASKNTNPGGGSASALIASVGIALGSMVGWMTYGRKNSSTHLDDKMKSLIQSLDQIMRQLTPYIDEDPKAYNNYINQVKQNPNQINRQVLNETVLVPLRMMRLGNQCWPLMVEIANHGNFASLPECQVGAKSLHLGIWGASRNIFVNVNQIKDDESFTKPILDEVNEILISSKQSRKLVLGILNQRIEQEQGN